MVGAGFRAAVLDLQKVIIHDGSHFVCAEHHQKSVMSLAWTLFLELQILLKYRQYEKYWQVHRQFLIGKLSEAAVVSNYVLPIIDGILMSLWGIGWLTCLCGSMEDAWRQNCRLALERNSLGSIPMKPFVVWDVENMWLQNNLIWICSCREMKGAWDLKNKKTGKFYGLRTHKTHHGWQQLQWCQATCS